METWAQNVEQYHSGIPGDSFDACGLLARGVRDHLSPESLAETRKKLLLSLARWMASGSVKDTRAAPTSAAALNSKSDAVAGTSRRQKGDSISQSKPGPVY